MDNGYGSMGNIVLDRDILMQTANCLTDDLDMETKQVYLRNVRSKCECLCVLQFTWHHRVSSVLHQPLSQIIHCKVLYLNSCK